MKLKNGHFVGKIINIPYKNLLEVEVQEPEKLHYYSKNISYPERIVLKSNSDYEEGVYRYYFCYIYAKDIVYILINKDATKYEVGESLIFSKHDVFSRSEDHWKNVDEPFKEELEKKTKKSFFSFYKK